MTALPTWDECGQAVKENKALPLHAFIYENEPSGLAEYLFREQLQAAINYAFEQGAST